MGDLISRQAAIDAADRTDYTGLAVEDVKKVTDEVVKEIKKLPSAQPTQTDTSNTLKALDCVERQAAIDALKRNTLRLTVAEEWNCEGHVAWDAEVVYSEVMEGMLLDLPSAQPNLQPTCNNLATDTISRQAAIDALEKWESESTWDEWCYDHKDEAEKYNIISPSSVVFGLPSALPDTQWIPCGPETMPKKTGYYLVQYTRKNCRNEMAVAFYSVEEARCDDDYTWEIETFSDIKEVIAWMPLPKPYKEGRKERTETHACDYGKKEPHGDVIRRSDVTDKLTRIINEMEEIFSNIRMKLVDDSVCGLCEYDCDHGIDGYANECPGFEKDDCFKLKDEYRKE